ncbi:hypothetical protein DCC85_18925 [Paenibacillus sp. CAA11]|nr:hypothetical protein DCC85_18925 [Paenibacillus sp. CAA11]
MEQCAKEAEDYGFAPVYIAELMYKQKPEIDYTELFAKIEQYTGRTQTAADLEDHEGGAAEPVANTAVWTPNEEEEEASGLMHFFHLNHRVQYEEGELPAQTSIMPASRRPDPAQYAAALQQAWHWPEAQTVLEQCESSLILTDLCAGGLPYQERLELFMGVLRALVETAPCEAIYWRSSDKLVEPAALLQALEEGQTLYGALSIRLYNVPSQEEERQEMVMDSCGLAALGIPDVQCHFYNMNPNSVAGLLMDIAYYLYNQGDIISDGETVGADESQRWVCEHQYSLASPRRVVLDLNPGEGYYAGGPRT